MKAFSIDPTTQTIHTHDFDGQVNSIYTFFNSILVDNSNPLNEHIVYTDANALISNATPYFIGEQLFLGKALILGQNGHEEVDAKISVEELSALINYEVNKFYKEALKALSEQNINLYKLLALDNQGSPLHVSYEWVVYTFNIADLKTQEYFLSNLEKTLQNQESVETFFQKMGQLALNAANR